MSETFAASQACAEFVSQLKFEDIPAEVLDVAKRDLLDWIGCAVAGAADPASEPVKQVTAELGGNAQATAIAAGSRNVSQAAMCNAYYGHILEMDDVDRESISHPATVNIATALAVAEYTGKTGRDALLAIVCGFETMLRVGAAITPAHYKIFHTTATSGVFGTAMAAGKLLGLSAARLNWALGNAGTSAAGLWQFLQDGGMSKFLHVGAAAANGVLVALLAQKGFSGATRILEGTQGFFAGYARQEVNYDLFRDFGKLWRTGLISFKPYPCCRHTHSAIDAAEEIRKKAGGRALKSVRLFTYSTAKQVAGKRAPATGRDARFSVTYCVASTILKGIPTDASFADSSVKEEDVTRLEAAIDMIEDPEITACVPRNWPCRIEAVTEDGEELVAQVWAPTGDPENTLSWEGVEMKFRVMTDGIIPAASQNEIIRLCRDFENVQNPGEVFRVINADFTPKY